ncbi:hypothetical protein ABWH88_02115 [Marinobacter adhaerens]|uniref:hypothetical protein n=1 Tax=Marinobacter adhaerens TaxID=1033846 RepID=UPI0035D063BF
MPDSKKPNSSRRAPVGVLTAKPIALRLLTEERSALEEAAIAEGRSMASQARIFFLQGLNEYQRNRSA